VNPGAPPSAGRPTRRFVIAAIGFGALFWLIYLAFVTTEVGQRAENAALRAAELRSETARADSLVFLSQVSVASIVGAMATLALVGLLRRRPGIGLLAVAVVGVAAVSAELLKVVLPRPELVDGPAWLLRNSFPSGTATVVASTCLGALIVAPDRLRWAVLIAAAAVVGFIVQATQITGWHRASDAFGGVVLSASVACAAIAIAAAIGHVQPSTLARVHRGVLAAVVVVAVAAVVVAGSLLLALVAFPVLRAPTGATSVFLHTASDLVTFGLAIAVLAGFTWLIAPYTLGAGAPAAIRPAPIPEEPLPPTTPDAEADRT
jgi:hypothetical protein